MISPDEISKIAELARLELDDVEAEALTADIGRILEYVRKLEQIEVSEVEPMSHVHGVVNVLREDQTVQFDSRAEILEQAPDRQENFVRAPIVIDPS